MLSGVSGNWLDKGRAQTADAKNRGSRAIQDFVERGYGPMDWPVVARTHPSASGFGFGRLLRHPSADEVARVVARVLFEIALVIILRGPEMCRRHDLGGDRPVEISQRSIL